MAVCFLIILSLKKFKKVQNKYLKIQAKTKISLRLIYFLNFWFARNGKNQLVDDISKATS